MAGHLLKQEAKVRRGLGIGVKMALLLCSVVAFVTVGGGIWTYLRFSDNLVRDELSRQTLIASSIETELLALISDMREDVAAVTSVPAVTGLLRAHAGGGRDPASDRSESQWRESLESEFRRMLNRHPDYSQVRLIGLADEGREIVRLDREGERIWVTPKAGLQSKHHRPYFRKTILSGPGEIYVSELELNEEHGEVVVPHMPVVRVGMPVFLNVGGPEGIVVINADLRPLLGRLRRILGDRYELYLFDGSGTFVLHPDPRHQFAAQLGSTSRIRDEFPELDAILHEPQGQRVIEHSSGSVMVANLQRLRRSANPDEDWELLVTGSYEQATAGQDDLKRQIIGWAAVLLAMTLGTVMLASRSITKPLRQITTAVQQFRSGDTGSPNLPLKARDEAGVLARAFAELSRDVREHDTEMEREIGVRRRVEQSLRQAQRQLRLALDATQAGVWVWDLEADSASRDEAAAKILNLPAGVDREQRWTDRVHPADRETVEGKLRSAREASGTFHAEFRVSDGKGAWKYVRAKAVSVRGTRERPVQLVGVCWDITGEKAVQNRLKRYAAELKRKNNELEEFVYSVSHDLKSPLVTCKGYLGLLRQDLEEGRVEDALDSAVRMETAADYMKSLIEDLLEVSRAGGVSSAKDLIDVPTVIEKVIEQCHDEESRKSFDVRIARDTPSIVADPSAIGRIFQNLISNAFKYAGVGPNPRVDIGGMTTDEETLFFVRDFGPGIAREYQDKIFGLFQRLDRDHEGTGIGLAIVRKVMDTYDGRCWVESEPGKGATFWVAFPQATPDLTPVLEEISL